DRSGVEGRRSPGQIERSGVIRVVYFEPHQLQLLSGTLPGLRVRHRGGPRAQRRQRYVLGVYDGEFGGAQWGSSLLHEFMVEARAVAFVWVGRLHAPAPGARNPAT